MGESAAGQLHVYVTDATRSLVEGAELRVDGQHFDVHRDSETGALVVEGVMPGSSVTLVAEAQGGRTEPLRVLVRSGIQQVVLGLRQQGELLYRRGDSILSFRPDYERYLVFVAGEKAASQAAGVFKELRLRSQRVPVRPGDDSRRAKDGRESVHLVKADADQAGRLEKALRAQRLDARIARPIRHRDEEQYQGLTGEIVASFQSDVRPEEAARIAAEYGLNIEREVRHAGNGYLMSRKGVPDYDVLDTANALADDSRVLWAEPNLLVIPEDDIYTPNDPLYAQLPHLPLINVDDAWDRLDDVAVNLRGGSPAICIGVVDGDGVSPNHPDLTANLTDGTGKLLVSWNFVTTPMTAQTAAGLNGDHGTQCAGSATAAFDDNRGLPGVAPNCRLIGAQRRVSTDELRLADLYMWMAGFANGSTDSGFPALPTQPADVITSSYGVNGATLSATMRALFDHLTTFGRNGRGVVLCWSLGNTGYLDFTNPTGTRHRAWPTYEKCLGVGSSINTAPTNPATSSHPDPNGNTTGIATQVDTRSLFSPFGATALRKPDLVSPSHTSYASAGGAPVDPIMSDVRVGTGAVDGCPGATVCNDYAVTFGGTSHSTPTVAGAVALMLSVRPDLTWVDVRDILRRTCARIDAANGNAIGQWQDLDGDGAIDYSRWYGYGRLDVDAAVAAVINPGLALADIYVRENLGDIGNVPSPGWHAHSPDIWVRKTNDPIPALAWTAAPPHDNPARGQDNYVFCRFANRGTAMATAVYVRASITHFPGFEFRYPQEFQPTTNVGDPVPNPITQFGTYLIGETRVDNVAPGTNTIIKMTWPQALIPPAQVNMGGVMVAWHPCLLLEVSPHDGPAPAPGVIAVRSDNNLAQRNITISDGDAVSDSWVGMIMGTFDKVGIRSLVIDGRGVDGEMEVLVYIADEEGASLLRRGIRSAFVPQFDEKPRESQRDPVSVLVRERTRLLLRSGGGEPTFEITAAPGSELRLADFIGARGEGDRARVVMDWVDGVDAAVVTGMPGIIEIPLPLKGGRFVPVAVFPRGDWRGELRLTQRRGDTMLSTGYTITR